MPTGVGRQRTLQELLVVLGHRVVVEEVLEVRGQLTPRAHRTPNVAVSILVDRARGLLLGSSVVSCPPNAPPVPEIVLLAAVPTPRLRTPQVRPRATRHPPLGRGGAKGLIQKWPRVSKHF